MSTVDEGVAQRGTSADANDRHRYLPYIAGLDGVRGLSILAVVVYHMRPTAAPGGHIGVTLFFALSGYLITTLLIGELRATGGVDLRRFWARRLRRLAPAALFVVLAVTLLSVTGVGFGDSVHRGDALGAIWNVGNWVAAGLGNQILRFLGPFSAFWSLAVEEQFYLFIALVFLVVRRTARPLWWLGVVAAVTFAASMAATLTVGGGELRREFGTDVRVAEIAAGCLLAVLLAWRPGVVRARWWEPLAWATLGAALLVTLSDTSQLEIVRGGSALLAVATTFVVLAVLRGGPLAWALSTGPLVYLGRISYAVYVVHWPLRLVLGEQRLHVHGVAWAVLMIALSVVTGALVHHFVEQPIRSLRTTPKATAAGWLAVSAVASLLAIAVFGRWRRLRKEAPPTPGGGRRSRPGRPARRGPRRQSGRPRSPPPLRR